MLQTLAEHLQMEQPQKTQTPSLAERRTRVGLNGDRRICQTQFVDGTAQRHVLALVDRIDAGKDHRLLRLEAGHWFDGEPLQMDGVTNDGFATLPHVATDQTHLTSHKAVDGHLGRMENGQRTHLVRFLGEMGHNFVAHL